MTTPREILRKHNIRPVKGLGQSFLIDNNINTKIVESSNIGNDDVVLEIGAGLGVLTAMLASCARKVIALEVDPKLLAVLREELEERANVEIVKQDVMTYDISRALDGTRQAMDVVGKFIVVGNIPYNIASQIFFRLIRFRESISSMILMFQREVAERIIASPGTKEYGLLSVLASAYTVPSKVLSVSPSCFYPRPKVDSTVVKMTIRDEPIGNVCNDVFFFALVKTALSKRRKTLLNNLKQSTLLQPYDIDIVDLLNDIGIDGRRRGETLTAEEFAMLCNAILSRKIS